ncbi:lytic murein transglycosylase [Rhodoplanes sp. Z2-YC6860]|uniref:lytic murein transglycosylase n=1 Tax=Rhodoplanes sp. Z2-YC6860 TaxID=674703 RepID=UPI00078BEC4E|nr:lytic murein transglycosylase [Rhodoplanes sp. Z2-YC6860]AMN41743.1 lytic murein transglycosylase [Rhodoplanes sp. Z2-YC6860]
MNQNRRYLLQGAIASASLFAFGSPAIARAKKSAKSTKTAKSAKSAHRSFPEWVDAFRKRAHARGVSDKTYDGVMSGLKPDTSVYALQSAQPEFKEQTWQYVNRRCSDWRVINGKEIYKQNAALLEKIEHEIGVDRYILLALWGVESAYGDPMVQEKYMRPIFPALAALAYGEPRRRAYWEQELLNALVIVERGWSKPSEMRGSWAGAMGHTQWMPEVWLHMGFDFDRDGRVSPFGSPADALASTARYLVKRGNYRRGERWGYEVKGAHGGRSHTLADWKSLGVTRADGEALPASHAVMRLWEPERGGPQFLIGQNFKAVRSYNPSNNYTLAICHLSDLLRGEGHFVKQFPGGERPPTVAELKELQERLTKAGFDTGGTNGRIGSDTMKAVRAYQNKVGIEPADGYAGLKVLARLRAGS